MNSLLHVPKEDLPAAFASVRSAVVDGGVVYVGQYGGIEQTGDLAGDHYEPKRFFSWLTDDDMRGIAGLHFTIEWFEAVDIGATDGTHFQSMLLRAQEGTGPGTGISV